MVSNMLTYVNLIGMTDAVCDKVILLIVVVYFVYDLLILGTAIPNLYVFRSHLTY